MNCPIRTAIAVWCMGMILAGCTDTPEQAATTAAPTGEQTTTAPAPTTTSSPLPPSTTVAPSEEMLNFSAIEGEWVGTGTEVNGFNFWIWASLSDSAAVSEEVGTVAYGLGTSIEDVDLDDPDTCVGTWFAHSFEDGVYRVNEIMPEEAGCADGRVFLELGPDGVELKYEYRTSNPESNATGTLTRVSQSEKALDFSVIAGDWTGRAEDSFEPFEVEATIDSSAAVGQQVATVDYYTLRSGNRELDCTARWIAESASHPSYTLREEVFYGTCPDGVVTLEYDSETETISYEYEGPSNAADATGTLTRDE